MGAISKIVNDIIEYVYTYKLIWKLHIGVILYIGDDIKTFTCNRLIGE